MVIPIRLRGVYLMMSMVVVYKAHVEIVGEVIHLLGKSGISATALDNPDSTSLYATKHRYLVRIAVDRGQAKKAGQILKQWEDSSKGPVEKYARKFRQHVIQSFLITAIVGVLWAGLGKFTFENLGWLFLIWVGLLVLISSEAKVRKIGRKLLDYRGYVG